jgi:hypothetical protein
MCQTRLAASLPETIAQTVKWPYTFDVCILDVIFDSRCLSVLLLLSDALPVRISTQSLVSCYLSLYTSSCLTNIRQRPPSNAAVGESGNLDPSDKRLYGIARFRVLLFDNRTVGR